MAGAFAGGGERGLSAALIGGLVPAALALAALIVFGRLALRPFFHFVAEAKSPEFFMAACLLVVLGDGLAAAASRLSMGLGAFVAGLLLAETEYRREIEVTIEPFKGLLLGLYFVSVRAGINPALIVARPGLILGLAAALIGLKSVILLGLARGFGLPARVGSPPCSIVSKGGQLPTDPYDTVPHARSRRRFKLDRVGRAARWHACACRPRPLDRPRAAREGDAEAA